MFLDLVMPLIGSRRADTFGEIRLLPLLWQRNKELSSPFRAHSCISLTWIVCVWHTFDRCKKLWIKAISIGRLVAVAKVVM